MSFIKHYARCCYSKATPEPNPNQEEEIHTFYINREYVEPGDEEFYLPIEQGSYEFIDHDSYLECLKLKPATAEKLLSGKYEGMLTAEHLATARNLVKLSRRHNFITLKMYGII